ncbi:RNA polymerase III RPC4-domain-containing protein [Peziza echinospora]|nr:RNA polymerase III RPC4-domain-containing protein [Peziza echinospora]
MPPKIKPKAPPRRGAAAAAAAAADAINAAIGTGTAAAQGQTTSQDTPASASGSSDAAAATTRSIAPPVGRLDSLRTGAASGSGSSASGSGSGATPIPVPAGVGGGIGGAARGGKAPLRFKPKAVVRKTAEERAALEAKVAPVVATPAPESGEGAGRGRGGKEGGRGGGRGRGLSSRGGRDRGRGGASRGGRGGGDFGVASTASGPFALGSVTSGRSKVILERGGGNEGGRSAYKSSYKSGAGGRKKGGSGRNVVVGPDGVKIDPDEGIEIYSSSDEESDGGPKVNVEHLEELGDSEEEDDEYEDAEGDVSMGEGGLIGVGKKKIGFGKGGKMPAMFPLRVERSRHEEKIAPPTIFKDPETGAGRKERGKKGKGGFKAEEGGVLVKPEPTDEDITLPDAPPARPTTPTQTATPIDPTILKTSQSPESLRKTMPPPAIPKPRRKSTSTPSGSKKPSSSSSSRRHQSHTPHSIEETMEFKREEEDRLATLRELGVALPAIESVPTSVPEGEDAEAAAAAEIAADISSIKPGDLFFFQFPSILPPLVRISAPHPATVDLEAGDSTSTTTTAATPDVKAEVGATPLSSSTGITRRKQKSKHHNPHGGPSTISTPLPSGAVGQLRIHRSGRVSILWGHPDSTTTPPAKPIEMEVARGADCEFLQDVVVIKSGLEEGGDGLGEKKDAGGGGGGGLVYSMGQVRGRFVVSPELGRLTEQAARAAQGGGLLGGRG